MVEWSKIIVIGAGGTGSMLFGPLCRYLLSKQFSGEIVICDGDEYSASNLERQMFSASKIGMNKAEYQALVIASHLPDLEDRISYIDKYLSQNDIENIVLENTIIINCVDNLAARKYVEDHIATLNTAAHICCGNELRHGQVQISLRVDGEWCSQSIYQDSPMFNSSSDDRSSMSCQQIADLPSGGQIIASNMMAAALALNYVLQIMPPTPGAVFDGSYVPAGYTYFDVMTNSFENKSLNQPRVLI